MKVLFATTNEAKIKRYAEEVKKHGIELITIKDLEFKLDVDENGKDAIENAYIKAKAYYDKTGIITIGMDNNLFFENVPDEMQPGVYVRRINGKELNDEEMIEYYSNLAHKFGGKIESCWVYGMVVYNGTQKREYSWKKDKFYITDSPSTKRNPGYPLDSISVLPELNKYFVDLTDEERNLNKNDTSTNNVVKFIVNSINELNI